MDRELRRWWSWMIMDTNRDDRLPRKGLVGWNNVVELYEAVLLQFEKILAMWYSLISN